jgi:hypothetical protein
MGFEFSGMIMAWVGQGLGKQWAGMAIGWTGRDQDVYYLGRPWAGQSLGVLAMGWAGH